MKYEGFGASGQFFLGHLSPFSVPQSSLCPISSLFSLRKHFGRLGRYFVRVVSSLSLTFSYLLKQAACLLVRGAGGVGKSWAQGFGGERFMKGAGFHGMKV